MIVSITLILNSLKSENAVLDSVKAQTGNQTEMEQTKSPLKYKKPANELMSTESKESAFLIVTKAVRCDSNLGIPSDEAVCKFVLDNVFPSQFTMTVIGNKSNPSVFQGSVNGTSVSVNSGNYTVSENLFDTRTVENLLGEATNGSVSTTALGDCIGQTNYMGAFQNATGTISSGDSQKCEIINTIEITSGETAQEP